MKNISFETSHTEHEIIVKIVERFEKMVKKMGTRIAPEERRTLLMDITACHANGCPLKLQAMLDGADFDFAHDVSGIQRHINRNTGKIEHCFLPRFADTARMHLTA